MPPGTGDAALTLTQQAPLSGAVIVTTANELTSQPSDGAELCEAFRVRIAWIPCASRED